MTVAEIVKKLLKTPCIGCNGTKLASCPDCSGTGIEPWSQDDYEKAWLVIQLKQATTNIIPELGISPSDYAEIERRVREWEKGRV